MRSTPSCVFGLRRMTGQRAQPDVGGVFGLHRCGWIVAWISERKDVLAWRSGVDAVAYTRYAQSVESRAVFALLHRTKESRVECRKQQSGSRPSTLEPRLLLGTGVFCPELDEQAHGSDSSLCAAAAGLLAFGSRLPANYGIAGGEGPFLSSVGNHECVRMSFRNGRRDDTILLACLCPPVRVWKTPWFYADTWASLSGRWICAHYPHPGYCNAKILLRGCWFWAFRFLGRNASRQPYLLTGCCVSRNLVP